MPLYEIKVINGYLTLDGEKYQDLPDEQKKDLNDFFTAYKFSEKIRELVKGKNKKELARQLSSATGVSELTIYNHWLNGNFSAPLKHKDDVLIVLSDFFFKNIKNV